MREIKDFNYPKREASDFASQIFNNMRNNHV